MLNSLVKPGSAKAFKLDAQKMEVSGSDTTFKKPEINVSLIILKSIWGLEEEHKLTLFPWQIYFKLSIVDLQCFYVHYKCIFP